MNFKTTALAISLLFSSLPMVAHADETEEVPPAEEAQSAKTHADVIDGVIDSIHGMADRLSKLENQADAKDFTETLLPATSAKLHQLLQAAQSLPAPTKEEKSEFNKRMKSAGQYFGETAMKLAFGLPQKPDLTDADKEAISEAAFGLSKHEPWDKAMSGFKSIYEDEEEAGIKPADLKTK